MAVSSIVMALSVLFFADAGFAQTKQAGTEAKSSADNANAGATPDLTKQPTLYVVGYAHLDGRQRFGRTVEGA
jgi:hypothetical protein